MAENKNGVECNVICWGIAAVVGFVSMIMLCMLADFGALQAIFVGGLIGLLLGLILSIFVCRGQRAAADLAAAEKPAQRYKREALEANAGAVTAAASAGAPGSGSSGSGASDTAVVGDTGSRGAGAGSQTGAGAADAGSVATSNTSASAAMSTPTPLTSSGVKPSAPLAGQAELAARKGEWKYEGDAAKAAPAQKAPAQEAATETVAASKLNGAVAGDAGANDTAAKAEPPKAAAKPKRAPVAADGKPELYEGPPAEGADDLKLISGVGPKLEQTLNGLGIYRFDQVAVWRKKEIAWVDDRLRFKGRIERDDWMSQAKILAKGGETEFSKRSKKK